ncbi:MAG: Inositol transport system permease protein, partial [uncultured Rubellimicrobium sp.]
DHGESSNVLRTCHSGRAPAPGLVPLAAHEATRARRRRRTDPRGRVLCRHRRPGDVQPRGRHQLPDPRRAARHPGARGVAPDDRWGVRPVPGLHGGLRGPDLRSRGHGDRLAADPRDPRHAPRGRSPRGRERADRAADRPAELHRDPRRPVHPAWPQLSGPKMGHGRLHAAARRLGRGRGRLASAVLLGRRVRRPLRLARCTGLDRDLRERLGQGARRSRGDRLVPAAHGGRDLGAPAHAGRQLDLRLGGRQDRRHQLRRPRAQGQGLALRAHGLLRGACGDHHRARRGQHRRAPGLPEGIRGHHRGGHRRRPSDRRLRLGRRRVLRLHHLRGRDDRPQLHRHRPGLVSGLPGLDAPRGRGLQQRHPQARDRGAL